jgi:CRP/FNR family transcriptional regulator, cyclic AMP receptor protein
MTNDRRHTTPARRADVPSAGGRVPLLELDREFRHAIPREERELAERILTVPCLRADSDGAIVGAARRGRRPAAVVLGGAIISDVTLADRVSAQLLGPGDVMMPGKASEPLLPYRSRWTATSGTVLALLDDRFTRAARRWPRLTDVIRDRLATQLDAAAVRMAIMSLPRVEQRILALFWQLAERWGTVRRDGVIVRLALTHTFIGRLIAARRPTVSLALVELSDREHLVRLPTGEWRLRNASRTELQREIADPRSDVRELRAVERRVA